MITIFAGAFFQTNQAATVCRYYKFEMLCIAILSGGFVCVLWGFCDRDDLLLKLFYDEVID